MLLILHVSAIVRSVCSSASLSAVFLQAALMKCRLKVLRISLQQMEPNRGKPARSTSARGENIQARTSRLSPAGRSVQLHYLQIPSRVSSYAILPTKVRMITLCFHCTKLDRPALLEGPVILLQSCCHCLSQHTIVVQIWIRVAALNRSANQVLNAVCACRCYRCRTKCFSGGRNQCNTRHCCRNRHFASRSHWRASYTAGPREHGCVCIGRQSRFR